ncbi:hypothetical protein CGCA056_v007970 [Colletotrichum aenigma]|uniref:uncharacterized protein n=1 Tax=Colletotrichum aenigma TaxID=1215731 RepID=UPI0018722A0B|nr:uncharacterized protein CGCA056_v007970 [Colletotrichum aenigma]KAF5520061.1 hypothetical protein CGCA056_v007970 [Colletotrichum aenigma]
MSTDQGYNMVVPAGLPLRNLDHDFNNCNGSILCFEQMQSLTLHNPLWREYLGNRLRLERRYGELLHSYEEAFAAYFGGFYPIDYGVTTNKAMNPDNIVKIILTLAEISMSESSDSSESPFTDEDDTLKRLGWEDIQAKRPRWALLSDTYAAAASTTVSSSVKPGLRFSSTQKPYGQDPILLHTEGVSDDELRDQLYEAKEQGCIGIIIEIVENQYNGRILDPGLLERFATLCAEESLLLAVDETLTAIRCGAPFSFHREEYSHVASPDIVFFGKATGIQGTAVDFDGQFLKRLGILGISRTVAVKRWQSQFQKPVPTADLIQALATLDLAIRGNLTMVSRIIGQTIRTFILEQAEMRGHEVKPHDILGGLESLIFVRKDIAGEFLVMSAKTAGSWIPWVKWLPRLESDMSRGEVLDEIVGTASHQAREDLSEMLVQKGQRPSWCFWCGNQTNAKKTDWCRRCCIAVCDDDICRRHLAYHNHI